MNGGLTYILSSYSQSIYCVHIYPGMATIKSIEMSAFYSVHVGWSPATNNLSIAWDVNISWTCVIAVLIILNWSTCPFYCSEDFAVRWIHDNSLFIADAILRFVVEWNTNSKNCHVAQTGWIKLTLHHITKCGLSACVRSCQALCSSLTLCFYHSVLQGGSVRSVGRTLVSGHSNESNWAVLPCSYN